MRSLVPLTALLILAGCSTTPESKHSQISPGARQDSNTEIPGKPQPVNEDAAITGVGYDQHSGEENANASEEEATNQVHYHYHVHLHHPDGSSYEVAGLPTGPASSGTAPGYATPHFNTTIHRSGFNFYKLPYSVPTSPYAHNPNDGNEKVGSYPYYSNIPGTGEPYYGGYGVGGYGLGSGGFNPYANDGAGGFSWSGDGD